MALALSNFILDICHEIEVKCGAKINFPQGTTCPTEEWITEKDSLSIKAIHLCTAEETKSGRVMKLQQFNPSAFLNDAEEIHCCVPGCSSTTQRAVT